MIVNNQKNYTSFINPDTSLISNHMNFTIIEHAYFEFIEEITALHFNKPILNSNLLYYIYEGGGTIYFQDQQIPIRPGKIYFYPCIKPEEYYSIFTPGTKKVHIQFLCNLYDNRDVFSDLLYPRELNDPFDILPKIKDTIITKNPGKQFLLTPLVQLTITPLLDEIKHVLSQQLIKGKKYSALFDFVENNLYIDTTIEKISQMTGYSQYTLTHTIPNEIGFTMKQYITEKVFRLIAFELRYTENLFRNIAEKYHFSSEAHFSNWFLVKTGVRPKKYRMKFRPENNYSFYQNIFKT